MDIVAGLVVLVRTAVIDRADLHPALERGAGALDTQAEDCGVSVGRLARSDGAEVGVSSGTDLAEAGVHLGGGGEVLASGAAVEALRVAVLGQALQGRDLGDPGDDRLQVAQETPGEAWTAMRGSPGM
ncbi:hypothetical protein ACIQJX_35755 [Streptomyces griseoviridis]